MNNPEFIYLPNAALQVIQRVEASGHEIYVVGGFVRNSLIYTNLDVQQNTDIDFTTDMLPDETIALFSDCAISLSGVKHGTVRVIFDDSYDFEITTYRIDGDYLDSRRPISVSFSNSLTEDLFRRDFTINALCYNCKTGIIDEFNGIDDISNKIVRTIGNPQKRFCEDPLRILRAFRFMATLGFSIEENTLKAAIEFAPLLKNISRERKTAELTKILCSKKPSLALIHLNELLPCFVDGFVPIKSELIDIIDSVEQNDYSFFVRWNILFSEYDFTKYDINEVFAISKKKRCKLDFLKNNGNEIILPASKIKLKKLLSKNGKDTVFMLFYYQKAMSLFKSPVKNVEKEINEIIELNECYCLHDLAVNGDDLIGAHLASTKSVKNRLEQTLSTVINGKVANEKEEILKFLESRKPKFIYKKKKRKKQSYENKG